MRSPYTVKENRDGKRDANTANFLVDKLFTINNNGAEGRSMLWRL
jgi:hypothetical protein